MHFQQGMSIQGEEHIRMHDHLRDLGRKIAQTHFQFRIWSARQRHFQQGMSIQGIISTRLDSWGRYIPPPFKENMEMMRISNVRIGLQVLIEGNDDLARECGEPRRGLLWFRGSAFQGEHRCIPSWLSLDNIRVLELICPLESETLWDDVHPPLQLIELLIDCACKLRSLPRSIGHLKHLKRLSFTWSHFDLGKLPLSSLPEEFCQLRSLEHLDLERCINLSSLPDLFGDLVNLRHINLAECRSLKRLPVSFKHLRRLEYLNLFLCAKLALESDNLENITNLKVFNIPHCRKLQVLPHNITNQPSLRKLDFRYNTSLQELPASIGQLSKLEELVIEDCPLLTRLPTSLGNLSSLATLTIKTCPKLYDIPCLAGLVSLKSLHVIKCPEINKIECLEGLVSLKSLRVIKCPEINKIEGLEGLVSLKSLSVIDCPEINKIEGLEQLTSLEELVVWTCWMVPGLHSLEGMERLHTVKLKAESLSVFDACIQNIEIEKWPLKTAICAKAFPGAESILDSFTFPGLDVVGSFDHPVKWSSLTCPDTNLSNAAIVCFLVRSKEGAFIFYEPFEIHRLSLSKGEWIFIKVFREVPPLIEYVSLSLSTSGLEAFGGWLIVGERSSIVEGFKQLFQTLCAVNSVR